MAKAHGRDAGCAHCAAGDRADIPFSFAFQPIVDTRREEILSYEALVRGPGGEPAASVLDQVNDANRYRFDQACRVGAIALAARLGMQTCLNVNFMPNAVYEPELCIRSTFAAAETHDFPIERIVFEVVENDPLRDSSRLVEIMKAYARFGFITAIDDFGAGFRDLSLLAEFRPDLLKIDMHLLRAIEADRPRQAIVRALIDICRDLDIRLIAEGVETFAEYAWLDDAGIDVFQGYLFARPAFESLATVDFAAFRRRGVRLRSRDIERHV